MGSPACWQDAEAGPRAVFRLRHRLQPEQFPPARLHGTPFKTKLLNKIICFITSAIELRATTLTR
jgi:hypothetical protein